MLPLYLMMTFRVLGKPSKKNHFQTLTKTVKIQIQDLVLLVLARSLLYAHNHYFTHKALDLLAALLLSSNTLSWSTLQSANKTGFAC